MEALAGIVERRFDWVLVDVDVWWWVEERVRRGWVDDIAVRRVKRELR